MMMIIANNDLIALNHYWDIVIENPIRDTQNLVALYLIPTSLHRNIYRNNSVATFFCKPSFQSGRINQR